MVQEALPVALAGVHPACPVPGGAVDPVGDRRRAHPLRRPEGVLLPAGPVPGAAGPLAQRVGAAGVLRLPGQGGADVGAGGGAGRDGGGGHRRPPPAGGAVDGGGPPHAGGGAGGGGVRRDRLQGAGHQGVRRQDLALLLLRCLDHIRLPNQYR